MSKELDDTEIQNLIVPLVIYFLFFIKKKILRLAGNENNLTCRVSAVNLIVPIV